jgi:hypothetical protein
VLSNILSAVNATLIDLFAAQYPTGPALQIFLGGEYLAGQDAGARVVWVPTEDRYEGIQKQSYALGGGIPRNLRNRWTNVDAHLWGQPPTDPTQLANYFDNVEILLGLVVQAIHKNTHGAYNLRGGQYPPATRDSGYTQYGRLYVLHVEWSTPLIDATNGDTITEITTMAGFPITGELEPFLPAEA